ncbi:uncharacterized protein BDZ99DRAFT_121970 [Mytilinidion resinicola]|uniref:Uncharacterized protein n=1 Tax=Mytilinidion resinicola TaxID=574789 RepID=A0A6A6Z681_9PEZI|nr:uncharacterized protein BDZ99DRAFT_121970 [Mytilinidion resinicola]KAF2815767.1 hypothetical protein BDZ99DRAFT_121970 [Mytilinidion resinicola]
MFAREDEKNTKASEQPSAVATDTKTNRFEVLSSLIEQDQDDFNVEPCNGSALPDASDIERSTIKDNLLQDVLDIRLYVLEMDSICTAVKQYWCQAAMGAIPLPFAAWLPNAGYYALKNIASVYSPAIGGHQGLLERYILKETGLMIRGINVAEEEARRSSQEPLYQQFSNGLGLVTPAHQLRTFRATKQKDTAFMEVVEKQPIQKFFLSAREEAHQQEMFMQITEMTVSNTSLTTLPEDEASKVLQLADQRQAMDRNAIGSILRSIKQLSLIVGEKYGVKRKEMQILLPEVRNYLQSRSRDFAYTPIVFGVQLMLETCKNFVWKDDVPNNINCRIKALVFPKEVRDAICEIRRPEITDSHTQAMATRLYNLAGWLYDYLKESRFDMFYQTSWVAGRHMTMILTLSMEAGSSLCNERGAFGIVLWMYNILR